MKISYKKLAALFIEGKTVEGTNLDAEVTYFDMYEQLAYKLSDSLEK